MLKPNIYIYKEGESMKRFLSMHPKNVLSSV